MKSSSVQLSNCERDFILQCIRSRKRLDGRETYDYRKLTIAFGIERGHCEVQLGKTRVLAQVSCEVTKPRHNRQTEGHLYINVELSPMASPSFEAGRMSELGVELNRFVERFYIESRSIDMESLCIVAGEKVWEVRVDLQVLDHSGNILDCACIAAIIALTHFRRPDVSVAGEEVTIHSADDRDPVPLSILHMPICVTFAFFDDGDLLLVDPSDKEECVMDGHMMMAMNIHREICGAVMGGGVSLETDQIIRCSKIAVVKVAEITELIKMALAEDAQQRSVGKVGVIESAQKITMTTAEPTCIDMTDAIEDAVERTNGRPPTPPEEKVQELEAHLKGPGTAHVGHGGANAWGISDDDDDNDQVTHVIEDEEMETRRDLQTKDQYAISDDSSEEEDVIILSSDKDSGYKQSPKPQSDVIDLTVALKKTKDVSMVSIEEKKGKKKKRKKKLTGSNLDS